MRNSIIRSLCIDVRRSVEVLMYGPLERVDAHIPYVAIDMDEWCDFMKMYRNQLNSIFLLNIDEMVVEHGLNRHSCVNLIASTYHQGVMAANILAVAGYENVVVEVGRRQDSAICSALIGGNSDSATGCHARYQWSNPTVRQLSGQLH